MHQQNYKNLFGLSALSGTFSIISKTERGNKYYKFDKLAIYGGVYYSGFHRHAESLFSRAHTGPFVKTSDDSEYHAEILAAGEFEHISLNTHPFYVILGLF